MEKIRIADIMTRKLITLGPNDTVDKVEEIFKTNNIHHIPIVNEEGHVVGIVSKSDFHMICHSLTFFKPGNTDAMNERLFKTLLVEELMTKQVARLNENDSLMVAAGFFKENLFRAIPIVNDQNLLVGIITTLDLINYAYKDKVKLVNETY